jgi:hypothetical protein
MKLITVDANSSPAIHQRSPRITDRGQSELELSWVGFTIRAGRKTSTSTILSAQHN